MQAIITCLQKMKNNQVFQKPYTCGDQLVNGLCIFLPRNFVSMNVVKRLYQVKMAIFFFPEPCRLEKEVKQEMERLQLTVGKHNVIDQYCLVEMKR